MVLTLITLKKVHHRRKNRKFGTAGACFRAVIRIQKYPNKYFERANKLFERKLLKNNVKAENDIGQNKFTGEIRTGYARKKCISESLLPDDLKIQLELAQRLGNKPKRSQQAYTYC